MALQTSLHSATATCTPVGLRQWNWWQWYLCKVGIYTYSWTMLHPPIRIWLFSHSLQQLRLCLGCHLQLCSFWGAVILTRMLISSMARWVHSPETDSPRHRRWTTSKQPCRVFWRNWTDRMSLFVWWLSWMRWETGRCTLRSWASRWKDMVASVLHTSSTSDWRVTPWCSGRACCPINIFNHQNLSHIYKIRMLRSSQNLTKCWKFIHSNQNLNVEKHSFTLFMHYIFIGSDCWEATITLLRSNHWWEATIAEKQPLLRSNHCWEATIAEKQPLLRSNQCWEATIAEKQPLLKSSQSLYGNIVFEKQRWDW